MATWGGKKAATALGGVLAGLLALGVGLTGCTEPRAEEDTPPETAAATPPPEPDAPGSLAQDIAVGFEEGTWETLPWATDDGVPSMAAAASAVRWRGMLAELDRFSVSLAFDDLAEPAPDEAASGAETATARYTLTVAVHPDGAENQDPVATTCLDTWVRLVRGASADGGQWRAVWSTALLIGQAVSDESNLVELREPAARGRILSEDGTALVEDRAVARVGVNKPSVPEGQVASDVARRLAELLEVDPDAYAARVEAAGPEAFVPALTLRTDQVEAYDLSVFGEAVLAQDARMPLAPTREFARALLGTSGEATAEIVEESGGAIVGGDTVGLSGLQRTFDQVLRGRSGAVLRVVPPDGAQGEPTVELAAAPAEAGRDVVLTLAEPIQTAGDNALALVADRRAALVAVRPSSGAVLAVGNSLGTEGVDIAVEGQYPPGSVFKVVTALAMMRQGTGPDARVDCPSSVTVDGRVFGNYDGYPASRLGQITVGEAFAYSCNTAFLGVAGDVSQEALAGAATDLGVGVGANLGMDAFVGSVPESAEGTEHAAEMIGQGQVLVSPLTMAVVAASAAVGARVTPRLVVDPDVGASDYAASPSGLTPDEGGALRSMMRSTVLTGTAQVLAELPGEVGAKTGTAEYGTEVPPETHAWMIAFDPGADLAVAVLVEGGGSGGQTAGPVVAAFLDQVGKAVGAEAAPAAPAG
ncbi:MAG: hypothetical protein LBJ08_06625 [Bifidobacteriaceae bacterium]|jgi:cell division protein FtsI/penicillin-binding protein 2|nr:hypothetical protein [Bifidobacteriaceae bacterium]